MHSGYTSQSIDVSIVIPVYRSRECLSPLVDELKVVFSSKLDEYTYEIVLVNDDSPDDSWEEIVRLSKIHVEVYGVSLSRNFGQHNATMAGLREARGQMLW
jgi:polyisoprenyl-phosphate glycosyltransferase